MQPRPAPELARRLARPALQAFLAFHLLAITLFALPIRTAWWVRLRGAVTPYLSFTGLWQHWDMFAPEPLRVNARLEANVTLASGVTLRWPFPEVGRLPLVTRYRTERFRKWAIDRVRRDDFSSIWPDTARWVARRMNRDPKNPPVRVELVRYWSVIPGPKARFVRIGQERTLPVHRQVFFRYTVTEADLRPRPW